MELNRYIDYTLLKVDATEEQVRSLCEDAIRENYKAVCVNPWYVEFASGILNGTGVLVCSVAGFPLGQDLPGSKVKEAGELVKAGADEVDMVANIAALKSDNLLMVEEEIDEFAKLCKNQGVISKVIVESGVLNFEDLGLICRICAQSGVNFVKTSTGFAKVGAEIEKVKEMRRILPSEIKIKASGGIRDRETALKMIDAGANRIGTSSLIK